MNRRGFLGALVGAALAPWKLFAKGPQWENPICGVLVPKDPAKRRMVSTYGCMHASEFGFWDDAKVSEFLADHEARARRIHAMGLVEPLA